MSAAGRDAGIENIGIFRLVLMFVCCNTGGVILTFELPMLEGTTNLTGAVSVRHFSGYFLAYSS
jgi:hypothetical protein